MGARVIALGQAAAGDDGVALAVLERLRERGMPDGVELLLAADDLALVPLLDTAAPVIIVDAVLHTPPGQVLELTPEELANCARPLSTHGIGVAGAIELAHALAPAGTGPSIRIVAVTITQPRRYSRGLSPAVAGAVPVAVERVMASIGAVTRCRPESSGPRSMR